MTKWSVSEESEVDSTYENQSIYLWTEDFSQLSLFHGAWNNSWHQRTKILARLKTRRIFSTESLPWPLAKLGPGLWEHQNLPFKNVLGDSLHIKVWEALFPRRTWECHFHPQNPPKSQHFDFWCCWFFLITMFLA